MSELEQTNWVIRTKCQMERTSFRPTQPLTAPSVMPLMK